MKKSIFSIQANLAETREVFITNVPRKIYDVNQVGAVYRIRWYEEIIFKSWKQCLYFEKIFANTKLDEHRTKTIIYLLLAHFAFFQLTVFHYFKQEVSKITDQPLSIIKYMKYFNLYFEKIINTQCLDELRPFVKQFAKHATYRPNSKIGNMFEKAFY